MRRILNLISIMGLLLAALGATTVPLVLADCSDGGSGDDIIDCTTGSVPGDSDVDGKGGDDTIYVGPDVTDVDDVKGDDTFFGGDDTITVDADTTDDLDDSSNDVVGDDAFWAGDDTIVTNGAVDDVVGDDAVYCYNWDEDRAESCNDSITVNGSADDVIGDDVYECRDGDCNDTITINGSADYVAGDYAEKCGTSDSAGSCNDTITINGDVAWVDGDNAEKCRDGDCNDTIVVNGTVWEQVTGDYVERCKDGSCNDSITVNESGYSDYIVGDDAWHCGDNACNDSITVSGSAGLVIGDNDYNDLETFAGVAEESFGGSSDSSNNDNITINGVAMVVVGDNVSSSPAPFGADFGGYGSHNGDDTINVNGAVYYAVVGDSTDVDFGCGYCLGGESFGGNSDGNDTININEGGYTSYIIGDSIDTSTCFSGCAAFGSFSSGNDAINVAGTVGDDIYADGIDGILIESLNGVEAFGGGSFTTRSDTITVSGTVGGDIFADSDFDEKLVGFDEVSFPGSVSIQDDTVILSSGGVQYIKKCGDINATLVGSSTPTASIGGVIYGGDWETHGDTLFIGLTSANGNDFADLQAQLDAAGETGSVTVGDHTYSWNDFENVQVLGTAYSEGATQLFDNGVVATYMGSDGKSIDICYQPEGFGFKVSLVNFEQLDQGVREFSLGKEGFTAIVSNDTSTCDPDYTPAGANWKVDLYQNGVLVDNHFCFIH